MEIIIKKQAQKYIDKTAVDIKQKLLDGIHDIASGKGDIIKLAGSDMLRYKIYHYRILFTVDTEKEQIVIREINTRSNVKY